MVYPGSLCCGNSANTCATALDCARTAVSNVRLLISIAISTLLLVLPFAHAQALYGSVTGTVLDSSGAVIPGATVTLKDLSKGTARTTETDSTGGYSFRQLIPDPYEVSVVANGFAQE